MAVLPESMDRLNPDDTKGSLSIVENYIRYMGERIEFSMRNVTRSVSEAGMSSAEVYVLITAMSNTLSALQSTVNGMSGSITSLSNDVSAIESQISTLETQLAALEATLKTQQDTLTALEARVTALETTNNGG